VNEWRDSVGLLVKGSVGLPVGLVKESDGASRAVMEGREGCVPVKEWWEKEPVPVKEWWECDFSEWVKLGLPVGRVKDSVGS